jgi:hypothetical protein
MYAIIASSLITSQVPIAFGTDCLIGVHSREESIHSITDVTGEEIVELAALRS